MNDTDRTMEANISKTGGKLMISNDQTDQNKMKKEESSFKKREIKHAVKKMKSKRLKGVTVKGVLK